jgi:integrase/recombinase XerC
LALITPGRAREVQAAYEEVLAGAELADSSRRAYLSRVSGFLRWLAGDEVGGSDFGRGDPLSDATIRDRAVRDYLSWLETERRARPSTVNAVLTALDLLYEHLGPGSPAGVARAETPQAPPGVLTHDQQARFLETANQVDSARDRAILLTLYYTGVRVAELVALDLVDIDLGARRAHLYVRESPRGQARRLPLESQPRQAIREWEHERKRWTPKTKACFVNRRGSRLTTRWVGDLVGRVGGEAQLTGQDSPLSPTVLRHTYGNRLRRQGTPVEDIADLLGYRRKDTLTRRRAQ